MHALPHFVRWVGICSRVVSLLHWHVHVHHCDSSRGPREEIQRLFLGFQLLQSVAKFQENWCSCNNKIEKELWFAARKLVNSWRRDDGTEKASFCKRQKRKSESRVYFRPFCFSSCSLILSLVFCVFTKLMTELTREERGDNVNISSSFNNRDPNLINNSISDREWESLP